MNRPVVLLMGPTATGKTDLALELADRRPTSIISVDSAMVYRGMDIGTAKPSATVRARHPHALVDVIDPSETWSVARFVEGARGAIDAAHGQGRLPVLVGGTMLYFRALLDGISNLPVADPAVRERLDEQADRLGWPAMHQRLRDIDPEAAERIHPNNPQRISRALEIFEISGRSQSDWWRQGRESSLLADPSIQIVQAALVPESRAALHGAIEQRFDAMLAAGLVAEVESLRGRGDLHGDLPAMRCVGYRQVWEWLEGGGSQEDLRQRGFAATRQLARRQETWLRRFTEALRLPVGGDGLPERVLETLQKLQAVPILD